MVARRPENRGPHFSHSLRHTTGRERATDLHRALCVLLLLVLFLVGGQAQAQQVRAYVDPRVTTPGEAITLSIEVRGGNAAVPRLPPMPDWRVQFLGQETSIESINFSFSQKTIFNYQLLPLKEGNLRVPAVSVTISGESFQTRPLQVMVRAPVDSPGGPGSASGGGQSQGQAARGQAAQDVIVEVEIEPQQVYVGQMMTQTLRVLTAVPLGQNIQVGRRPIPGTVDEELGEQAQRQITRDVDGVAYRGEEVRWVFYPITAGPLTIPSMEVTVPIIQRSTAQRRRSLLFDDMFGGLNQVVPKLFQSEEQQVEVRALPAQGRPPEFSGLVGRFQLESRLPQAEFALGDSVTQSIEVRGEGNLRNLSLPPLQDPAFKVYDDAPETEVQLMGDGQVRSTRTFKRALVPQRAGQVEVPPVKLSYFDPTLEQYQTLSSEGARLTVAPGAGGLTSLVRSGPHLQQSPESAVVATGHEDILPIVAVPELLQNRRASPTSTLSLLWLLSPMLGFVGIALGQRLRARRGADSAGLRRRQGATNARQALKALKKNPPSEAAGLDALSRILRSYLGDKLGCEGGALTSGEVRQRLLDAGASPEQSERLAGLLAELEAARYAPQSGSGTLKIVIERLEASLEALEREL